MNTPRRRMKHIAATLLLAALAGCGVHSADYQHGHDAGQLNGNPNRQPLERACADYYRAERGPKWNVSDYINGCEAALNGR